MQYDDSATAKMSVKTVQIVQSWHRMNKKH